MYIPTWGLVVMGILYIYLIGMDVRLHRRIKKLELMVCNLEGKKVGESNSYAKEDVT